MPEILHRIGVDAPIGKVYEALTTSHGISSWWTRKVTGAAKVGSEMEMRFKNDTLTMKFRIEELTSNALVSGVSWRDLRSGSAARFSSLSPPTATGPWFCSPISAGRKSSNTCTTAVRNGALEDGRGTPPDEQPASKWG